MSGINSYFIHVRRASTHVNQERPPSSPLLQPLSFIIIAVMSLCLMPFGRAQTQTPTVVHSSPEATSPTKLNVAPAFAKLLEQASSRSPKLREQAANTRAAIADVRQASARLNPTLSVNVENLRASHSGGQSQRQDTYILTQTFEVGGKRAARIEAEQGKSIAAQTRERQAYLLFASELAIAYATAEAMQQRQEVADAELTAANEDLRATQALVKAGREAELRVLQAQASVAAAQANIQSAIADANEAFERLSALAGVSETYTNIRHPIITTMQSLPALNDWTPDSAPELRRHMTELAASEAVVRVEQKRWIPDVGVSLGVRKIGWNSDNALTMGVTANIPLFDRNQDGIDAARERATSAAMRVEAARLASLAQRRSALAQVTASEKRLQATGQGEHAAQEAYRLGRIAYEAGKSSLVELLAIRRALSEAKSKAIDAHLARVRALAALSLAEGRIAFTVFGETP